MSVTLTYYGHNVLGFDIDGVRVLVDPFFTGNPVAETTADEIVDLDYILITHGHADHVGDAVAIAKRTGATVIANFEISTWFAEQGVEKVHGQHIGGAFKHAFGILKLTIAHHGSSLPDGSNGGPPAGLLIKTPAGPTIYVAGDTGLFYDMKLIGEEGVDLAILPIGDNFTMGPDDALRALKLIEPKAMVPVHFNTWEVINQDVEAFATRAREETDVNVHVMAVGDTLKV